MALALPFAGIYYYLESHVLGMFTIKPKAEEIFLL